MTTKKKASKSAKTAAILTIRDADKMTKKGRREIADWLRARADDLIEHGDQLAATFCARYYYL